MKLVRAVLMGVLGVILGVTSSSIASAAPSPVNLAAVGFSGTAYASVISGNLVGTTLSSSPSAMATVGCTQKIGATHEVSSAGTATMLGKTGTTSSKVTTSGTLTSRTTTSTVEVQGLNLVSGLVSASAVSATASSTVTATGVRSGTQASRLTDLKISGVAVPVSVAPNTTIELKLDGAVIGKVVVNQQQTTTVNGFSRTQSTALMVVLSADALGLKAGTVIHVGRAVANLTLAPAGFASGVGSAVKAVAVNGQVTAGPVGPVYVPCVDGTSAANIGASSVPSALTVGAASGATQTTSSPTLSASTTVTVNGVNALQGVLSTGVIKASVSASRATKTGPVTLTDNSSIADVRLAGVPIVSGAIIKPNTVITVPGLGTVTFHKVTKTATSITVVMVEIKLSQALGSLPTGSIIQVGSSSVQLH